MREILFRGKTEQGKWVQGYYLGVIQFPNSIAQNCIVEAKLDFDFVCKTNAQQVYTVIPETVGQYTGLTDKKGKKIFEGDIAIVGSIRYIVAFKGAEWKFSHISGQPYCYPFFASHAKDSEVIGNIHDNPELWEVDNG